MRPVKREPDASRSVSGRQRRGTRLNSSDRRPTLSADTGGGFVGGRGRRSLLSPQHRTAPGSLPGPSCVSDQKIA
ncbi:MAG: hypothetical protein EBR82_13840 [Caulobacteraceae bacterium]|nr:hypothetical protein [Caulobacteraceae bacterium]